MTNRIQVKETKRYWGDFEGSLGSIISSLQSELDDGWEGIETGYEWPYSQRQNHEVPCLKENKILEIQDTVRGHAIPATEMAEHSKRFLEAIEKVSAPG